MHQHLVGKATVTRIEETYLAVYDPKEIFPEFTEELCREHAHWLAPNHYDPATGKIKLSVHSWLLQIGGSKILANGRSYTIIGVMPARFEFPIPLFGIQGAQFGEQADIWKPIVSVHQDARKFLLRSQLFAAALRSPRIAC